MISVLFIRAFVKKLTWNSVVEDVVRVVRQFQFPLQTDKTSQQDNGIKLDNFKEEMKRELNAKFGELRKEVFEEMIGHKGSLSKTQIRFA